ncbi:hypothetical protein SpCBS45565_g06283 [Spizellomyces sp. 'palustris']|nr:hypothetical protein SpCBS45565_g06283 [Spizellomyces sp. 'palustris']
MTQLESSALTLPFPDDRLGILGPTLKASLCRDEFHRSIRRTSSAGDIPRTWKTLLGSGAFLDGSVRRGSAASTGTSTSSGYEVRCGEEANPASWHTQQQREDGPVAEQLQRASYLSDAVGGVLGLGVVRIHNHLVRGEGTTQSLPRNGWKGIPTVVGLDSAATLGQDVSSPLLLSTSPSTTITTQPTGLKYPIAVPASKQKKPLRPALRRPSSPIINQDNTDQPPIASTPWAKSEPALAKRPPELSSDSDFQSSEISTKSEPALRRNDMLPIECEAGPSSTTLYIPSRKGSAPITMRKRSNSFDEKGKGRPKSANGPRKGSDGAIDVEPRVSFSEQTEHIAQGRRGSGSSFSEGHRKAFSAFMGQTRKPSGGPNGPDYISDDDERGMRIFLEQCQKRRTVGGARSSGGASNSDEESCSRMSPPPRKGSSGKEKKQAASPTQPQQQQAEEDFQSSLGRKRARSTGADKTYTTTTTTHISNMSIFKPLPGDIINADALPVTVVAEHPAAFYHHHPTDEDDPHDYGNDVEVGDDDADEGSVPNNPRKSSGSIRNRKLILQPQYPPDETLSIATLSQSIWRPGRHHRLDAGSHAVEGAGSGRRRSDIYAPSIRSPWLKAVRLPPRWLSLRNAMALTNVIIIVFAIIVIAVVSYVSGKDNARVALEALGTVALKSIAFSIGSALGRAEESNAVTVSAVETWSLRPDTQVCAGYYWSRVKRATRWNGDQIYVVDLKGSFCGVFVNSYPGFEDFTIATPAATGGQGKYTLRLANGTAPAPRYSYSLNSTAAIACPNYENPACVANLLASPTDGTIDFYDATQRPYYRRALSSPLESWTGVYNLGSGDGYGLTNVMPVHQTPFDTNSLVAIAAVDIRLRSLSQFLKQSLTALLRDLDPSRPDVLFSDDTSVAGAIQFVVADVQTGIILASTCDGKPGVPLTTTPGAMSPPPPDDPPQLFASMDGDPCLGDLPSTVGSLSNLPVTTVLSDEDIPILSTPLQVWSDSALVIASLYQPRVGLQWAIIGRVPGQYFHLRLGQIYTLTIPLTAALVLVASALASFLVTRAIGRPLKRAAEKMMRIADLNFDEDAPSFSDDDTDGGSDYDEPPRRRWSLASLRFGWSFPGRRNSNDSQDSTDRGRASTVRRSFFLPPRSRSTSRSARRRRRSSAASARSKQVPFVLKEIQLLNTAMDAMTSGLKSFSKYVPLDVVALLVKMKREAVLGVDEMSLSIFFSDIANFTTIAESMSPQQLVLVMSEYLSEMSSIILESQGIVDKFIGDAVMAFWNAPLYLEEHAIVACDAALKSQERLKELRDDWLVKGYPEIRARIGLNTGPALVGNLGSPTRLNYTCLGDTVNLASRLEGLNKRYNTSIIVSDAVRDQVHEYFVLRPLDYVAVKGKTVAKKCYELVDSLDACDPAVLRRMMLYEKAFDYYCQGEFEQAKVLFETYLVDVPWDVPAITHLEECMRLEEEGVPMNWSPVVVLDEK